MITTIEFEFELLADFKTIFMVVVVIVIYAAVIEVRRVDRGDVSQLLVAHRQISAVRWRLAREHRGAS